MLISIRRIPSSPVVSNEDNNTFIQESIEMGAAHWEEEIDFLQARLSGKHGDIDDEDREACQEALQIARENLADALTHRTWD